MRFLQFKIKFVGHWNGIFDCYNLNASNISLKVNKTFTSCIQSYDIIDYNTIFLCIIKLHTFFVLCIHLDFTQRLL